MFQLLRALKRATHVIVLTAGGVLRVMFSRKFRRNKAARSAYLQQWCGRFVRALNIRTVVHGTPPTGNGMVVPNHLGMPDGQVVASVIRGTSVMPVAKRAIGSIPGIGYLAGQAGSILVKRGSDGKISRSQIRYQQGKVHHRMDEHGLVLVFLEGTTGAGDAAENAVPVKIRTPSGNMAGPRVLSTDELLPFKTPLLEPALETGYPVTPVTLVVEGEDARRVYNSPHGKSGKTYAWELLTRKKPITIHLYFGTPRVLDPNVDIHTHAKALRDEILATYRQKRAELNGTPVQKAA